MEQFLSVVLGRSVSTQQFKHIRNMVNCEVISQADACHGESISAERYGQSFGIDGRWTYYQR